MFFKKIKILLSKKQLNYFYLFIFLSFISMILETAGVGIVVPFLQIFVGDGANDYLINFFNSIGIYTKSKNDLIFILILVLIIIYTFKASFLTFVSYIQSKYISDTRVYLKNKLYDAYLKKPYIFHWRFSIFR